MSPNAKENLIPLVEPPSIPGDLILGSVTASWEEIETGIALITCEGGTVDDRELARFILSSDLYDVGIKQAQFDFDEWIRPSSFQKEADYQDRMNKAQRLMQSGNVTLLRNGYNVIVANVIGDHGQYQCEISRDDPNSRSITQWTCTCPAFQFSQMRTRKWKKWDNIPCSHTIAAYWSALGTPLDEALTEQQAENMGTGQAIGPSGFGADPMTAPPMGAPQGQQGMMPGMGQGMGNPPSGGPMMAPDPNLPPQAPGAGIIPAYPMDPAMMAPVSVPNTVGPTPRNPMQQPGTLSHIIKVAVEITFPDWSIARLKEDTMGQTEGIGTSAGGWQDVPKGSLVDVIHQDPTTGWVECTYDLSGGNNSPFHVRFFVEPTQLSNMNMIRKGPQITKL